MSRKAKHINLLPKRDNITESSWKLILHKHRASKHRYLFRSMRLAKKIQKVKANVCNSNTGWSMGKQKTTMSYMKRCKKTHNNIFLKNTYISIWQRAYDITTHNYELISCECVRNKQRSRAWCTADSFSPSIPTSDSSAMAPFLVRRRRRRRDGWRA